MKPATRARATALLAAVLSIPTVLTLFAGDIGATTAIIRVLLAIAVAMAAVAVLGAIVDRASAGATQGGAPVMAEDAATAGDGANPVPEAIPPPPISAFVEPTPLDERVPAPEPPEPQAPVFGDLGDDRAVEDQPPL